MFKESPCNAYAVTVDDFPTGVTIGNSGNITITGSNATLTLNGNNTSAAGTTSTPENPCLNHIKNVLQKNEYILIIKNNLTIVII